jgi:hypothetical protein
VTVVEPTLLTEELNTVRTVKGTPDDIGKIFSEMDDHDQLRTLRAMVKHMDRWPRQWDSVALQLEKKENEELRNALKQYLF